VSGLEVVNRVIHRFSGAIAQPAVGRARLLRLVGAGLGFPDRPGAGWAIIRDHRARYRMALFDDIPLFEEILSGGNWATGLAIGVGAVVVLPLAVPILRPLAKTAIKGGILAYRGAAGWVEGIGDLFAEAVAESGGEVAPRAVEGAAQATGMARPRRGTR